MRLFIRQSSNKLFTALAGASVLLLLLALIIVLTPMLYRGSGAVFFTGTVEFRKMQFDRHKRGNAAALQAESQRVNQARQPIYDILDHFSRGIDTADLTDWARALYRQYGQQLRFQEVPQERYSMLREQAKSIRDTLCAAFDTVDRQQALTLLDQVLQQQADPDYKDTAVQELFALARDYQTIAATIDLTRREQYARQLAKVRETLTLLLGPRPDEPTPALYQDRYGATRWDQVQKYYQQLMTAQEWLPAQPGQPYRLVQTPRADFFAGTELAELFALVEKNLEAMLAPRFTFYWQNFFDDSTPGHFFGGVGPEILGTLILTVLSMAFAVPLGVTAAGYLVECAGDTLPVRVIRICINTLAGVPSIVFGLFGLAFFVKYFFPRLGLPSKACILAAALTLAVLVLPVIIRASEEAIRAVPRTYKEASLALGAGAFRTFMLVTLPAALPGILTGVILSLSRAAGETAPILFCGAVALGPLPQSILDPTRSLSYGSYDIAVGDRLSELVPHQQYGMVATLILLVLSLNIAAIVLRGRLSRKLRGG